MSFPQKYLYSEPTVCLPHLFPKNGHIVLSQRSRNARSKTHVHRVRDQEYPPPCHQPEVAIHKGRTNHTILDTRLYIGFLNALFIGQNHILLHSASSSVNGNTPGAL